MGTQVSLHRNETNENKRWFEACRNENRIKWQTLAAPISLPVLLCWIPLKSDQQKMNHFWQCYQRLRSFHGDMIERETPTKFFTQKHPKRTKKHKRRHELWYVILKGKIETKKKVILACAYSGINEHIPHQTTCIHERNQQNSSSFYNRSRRRLWVVKSFGSTNWVRPTESNSIAWTWWDPALVTHPHAKYQ